MSTRTPDSLTPTKVEAERDAAEARAALAGRATYPQIDYAERDRLVDAIYAELDPDGYGWAAGDGPTVDEVAKALLASDWLAAHDAQVRAEALREAAERYRRADRDGYIFLDHKRVPWAEVAMDLDDQAARIARSGS